MPALATWRAVMLTGLMGVTVAAAAAQCGVLRMPAPSAAPGPTSAPETALPPDRRCFGPGAGKLVLTTSDGVRLAGALLGSGPRGVVLLHHGDKDMCQVVRYARRWAEAGYRVVAFDLRCHGLSDCAGAAGYAADAAAAVEAARGAGAGRVVLVGGGLGADVALVAAARLGDRVAGVVAISPDRLTTVVAGGDGPLTPEAAARQMRAPVLVVDTKLDASAGPAAEMAAFLAAAPSTDKTRLTLPGTARGWNLLNTGGTLPDQVDAFLAKHTG